jgi:two-component system chemotaxis response regulator CheB
MIRQGNIEFDLGAAPSARHASPDFARTPPSQRPEAIVIGASTGGPQALPVLLRGLAPIVPLVPVLIVLHIPPEFAPVVAAQIEKVTKLPTHIAEDGEPVTRGHVYLSPGDRHLGIAREGETAIVLLSDDPPENFCKPSVDVLFRTAAQVHGPAVIGIVLTGMGSDGLAGARAIVAAGGAVVAQDFASSAVWGMPRSVANEGLALAVLPLNAIGSAVCRLVRSPRFREKKL